MRFTFDRRATPTSYGFTIESDSVKKSYDVTISGNYVKKVTDRDTGATDWPSYGKSALGRELRRLVSGGQNCCAVLALKLASDWGQIEHCRRHGYIFVSCDRLAAFYCVFRGANLMYVNHHDRIQTGATKLTNVFCYVVMTAMRSVAPITTL